MAFKDEYHGISKDEAVEKLNSNGFSAIYDKGIVQIKVDPDNPQMSVKNVESFLKEIDYRMSYGFTRKSLTQAVEA